MVPALAWPWVFTLGYVLVAPLGCTTFSMPQVADGGRAIVEGSTRCDALFFAYAGDAAYSPPIWPALLVGLAPASAAALIARRWIAHRARRSGAAE